MYNKLSGFNNYIKKCNYVLNSSLILTLKLKPNEKQVQLTYELLICH